MRAVFRPEAELTLFLRMRTKEIIKTAKMYSDRRVIPVTGNGGRLSEHLGQIFDRKLVNRRFCTCAVKNRLKTRLLCCEMAKILAHLWAIAVAEHDGEGSI